MSTQPPIQNADLVVQVPVVAKGGKRRDSTRQDQLHGDRPSTPQTNPWRLLRPTSPEVTPGLSYATVASRPVSPALPESAEEAAGKGGGVDADVEPQGQAVGEAHPEQGAGAVAQTTGEGATPSEPELVTGIRTGQPQPQSTLHTERMVSDPFPPLPVRTLTNPFTRPTAPVAARGRKKGKGKAAARPAPPTSLGLGRPPVNRVVSPTSPSPNPNRQVSEARKRRRAEADVEGDMPQGPAVTTVITPVRLPAHFTRVTRAEEPPQTQVDLQASDEDVDMDVALPEGDEGEIDTFRMMYYHNIDPYDVRPRHMPPPVDPPAEMTFPQAAMDTTSYDPAVIRARGMETRNPRPAPPHLVGAYRTELDEGGGLRPNRPGPPTRRPVATQPLQNGEFGSGATFDRQAFHASTFRAPPFQLRPRTNLGGTPQGATESPFAYAAQAHSIAAGPSYHNSETDTTRGQDGLFDQRRATRDQPTPRDPTDSSHATPEQRNNGTGPEHESQNPLTSPRLATRTPETHSAYRPRGALWGTTTAATVGPPLGPMTPAPQGGWRLTQGSTPLWKFMNQDPEQVSAWLNDDTPSCLAHIPGMGATNDGRWDRRGQLESVLRRAFRTEHVWVTLPTPAIPQTTSNAAPYFLNVRAKDGRVITTLLGYVWMSMAEITIGFLRLDLDPPTLVASFQDIHAFAAETEVGIADLVVDALLAMSDIVISLIIEDIANDSRWRSFSALEAFDNILHSVRVRIVKRRIRGDIIDPVAMIYCQSPTADTGGWEAFRHHIQSYPFGSAHSGRPQPCTSVLWCALCHTIDHPTGLCYLPDTPMWHGPSVANVTSAATTRGPPRGRGGRGGRRAGRGAARGRGGR